MKCEWENWTDAAGFVFLRCSECDSHMGITWIGQNPDKAASRLTHDCPASPKPMPEVPDGVKYHLEDTGTVKSLCCASRETSICVADLQERVERLDKK